MQTVIKLFRDPAGIFYHSLAVSYALLGYFVGLVGLFHSNLIINIGATILLAHAMVIAAYMIHECGHNTVFWNNRWNAYLGNVMSWLCGASYGTFEDMRYKHFRHHIDNDDVVWFDYESFFHRHPVFLKITRILEWFYIPAHDLIMHFIMVFTSFIIPERREQRKYNVTIIVIRGSIFLVLFVLFPKVALLYMIAYMMMMQVLRFMDSLQHDYGPHTTLFSKETPPHKGDAEWEQEHTFSNPISSKYDVLNWLTLNFGFHNAHHARPTVPWFRLPALHRELFGTDTGNFIPFSSQLKIFHIYRVERILHTLDLPNDEVYPSGQDYLRAAQNASITGGNAASFLTSF